VATVAEIERIHTEVLALVAQGMTSKRIGQRLYLAEDTVKSRLTKCYRLLGASNRAQAVAEANRRGLLSRRPTPPPPRPLTEDEQDLLTLIAEGLTYPEIGARWDLTEANIKGRVKRIRRIVVGARDAAQLVHLAHVHGLLPAAARQAEQISSTAKERP
jgi:DNA-binding NarL/FixJ family response regulator